MRLRIVRLPYAQLGTIQPFMFVLDRIDMSGFKSKEEIEEHVESWKGVARAAGAKTIILSSDEIELEET